MTSDFQQEYCKTCQRRSLRDASTFADRTNTSANEANTNLGRVGTKIRQSTTKFGFIATPDCDHTPSKNVYPTRGFSRTCRPTQGEVLQCHIDRRRRSLILKQPVNDSNIQRYEQPNIFNIIISAAKQTVT